MPLATCQGVCILGDLKQSGGHATQASAAMAHAARLTANRPIHTAAHVVAGQCNKVDIRIMPLPMWLQDEVNQVLNAFQSGAGATRLGAADSRLGTDPPPSPPSSPSPTPPPSQGVCSSCCVVEANVWGQNRHS
jgi:hypothetical protein